MGFSRSRRRCAAPFRAAVAGRSGCCGSWLDSRRGTARRICPYILFDRPSSPTRAPWRRLLPLGVGATGDLPTAPSYRARDTEVRGCIHLAAWHLARAHAPRRAAGSRISAPCAALIGPLSCGAHSLAILPSLAQQRWPARVQVWPSCCWRLHPAEAPVLDRARLHVRTPAGRRTPAVAAVTGRTPGAAYFRELEQREGTQPSLRFSSLTFHHRPSFPRSDRASSPVQIAHLPSI